jgi:hypothetical protein
MRNRANRGAHQRSTTKWSARRSIKRSNYSLHLQPVCAKTRNRGSSFSTEGVTTPPGGGELRCSTCSTAGRFQTAPYVDVFLARVKDYEDQSNYSQMAYLSELQTDWDAGTVNISGPIVYTANMTRDADNPSFHEAMHGDQHEQYLEAMNIEITS